MAGGKETPRQKMIGMMYLVLTALLALQVSSAIMMKFKFLDDSLMGVNAKTIGDNVRTISSIQASVEEKNLAADRKVLEKAQAVRTRTSALIKEIDALRTELIKVTGGTDEDGMYVGAKEEELVMIHMVGNEQRKGVAYQLKDKLNNYASFITEQVPQVKIPNNKLAMDGSEDPLAKKDPQQRRKDFATLNFAQTPLVAALAVLAQKESEILKYESDALSVLGSQVGATIIKFEKMYAMASAEAKYVAAGTKYNADMFLSASSDAIVPTMTAQGRPVKVEGGRGKVEFTAAAGAYDKEGQSKQKWKGTIKFPFNGRDTTFTLEQEYVVVKPVIKVESQAVSALYFNCGNALNITVPALGALYDPSFSATGGTAIKGAKKGEVTIIPNSKQVKINVSSGGNAIGSETFSVRPIP
ncbi:MAG: gliding motility protein GldM, partial [Sphingobacteriales bacterium]